MPQGKGQEGENVGHHRYKIIVDAYIEAPKTVPNGQDPSEAAVAQALTAPLTDLAVGGQYVVKVDQIKVKKGKAEP